MVDEGRADAMSDFRKTAEIFRSGAETLPQEYLTSQEIFAQEEERIFSSHWLCAGHQNQIGKPGDYFLQTVAGESLIFGFSLDTPNHFRIGLMLFLVSKERLILIVNWHKRPACAKFIFVFPQFVFHESD